MTLLSYLIIFPIFFMVFSVFFIVKQQRAGIIERFGKFHSVRQSGLQLKIPVVDRIAGKLSLKIQQLDVIVETKTKDDVFVKIKVLKTTAFPLLFLRKPLSARVLGRRLVSGRKTRSFVTKRALTLKPYSLWFWLFETSPLNTSLTLVR